MSKSGLFTSANAWVGEGAGHLMIGLTRDLWINHLLNQVFNQASFFQDSNIQSLKLPKPLILYAF